MAGAFFEDVYDWWDYGAAGAGPRDTPAWDTGQRDCLDTCDDVRHLTCPLAPTDSYYYNQYDNTVKQLAFFGEMTYDLTDKWSVTGGARWFEFDRDTFDLYQVPLGLPAESDPDANGLSSQSTDSDTTFKFATRVPVHAGRDGLRALQRGFPPRRRELARAPPTPASCRRPTARTT